MASLAIDNSEADSSTRRETRRYAVETELRYELLDGLKVIWRGAGKTVNISSGGVLFESSDTIPAGTRVQLFIAWPARLHGETHLQLCACGVVVRSDGSRTAVQIQRHEFRTKRMAA